MFEDGRETKKSGDLLEIRFHIKHNSMNNRYEKMEKPW